MISLVSIILSTIAVIVTVAILPGIRLEKDITALVVAVVLGFINAFIRPVVILLTLPINILTLGLFTLVIMAFMVILVSWIVPGFTVNGFWSAMAFALVFAVLNNFLNSFVNY